jgi:hypothetical protein
VFVEALCKWDLSSVYWDVVTGEMPPPQELFKVRDFKESLEQGRQRRRYEVPVLSNEYFVL